MEELNSRTGNTMKDTTKNSEIVETCVKTNDSSNAYDSSSGEQKKCKIMFSSNEAFENVEGGETSVELSGVVTQIECPKLVGKKHQYKLFTFILNNLMGQKCRVCVWNNEIEKFEPLVKPRSVLHIEGALAEVYKDMRYNNTKLKYQLILKSNTKVNVLEENYEVNESNLRSQVLLVPLGDIGSYINSEIRVEGYLKTQFNLLQFETEGRMTVYSPGSITDLQFKVEIRFLSQETLKDLLPGQKIEVIGTVRVYLDTLFIDCKNSTDIKCINEERISFFELEKGFKMPPFTKIHENNNKK